MTEHIKAEWYGNEHNLPGGSYINKYGSVGHIKSGKLHREDGPAIGWSNGNKEWWINGERHTEEAYEEALKIWKINEAMK